MAVLWSLISASNLWSSQVFWGVSVIVLASLMFWQVGLLLSTYLGKPTVSQVSTTSSGVLHKSVSNLDGYLWEVIHSNLLGIKVMDTLSTSLSGHKNAKQCSISNQSIDCFVGVLNFELPLTQLNNQSKGTIKTTTTTTILRFRWWCPSRAWTSRRSRCATTTRSSRATCKVSE